MNKSVTMSTQPCHAKMAQAPPETGDVLDQYVSDAIITYVDKTSQVSMEDYFPARRASNEEFKRITRKQATDKFNVICDDMNDHLTRVGELLPQEVWLVEPAG